MKNSFLLLTVMFYCLPFFAVAQVFKCVNGGKVSYLSSPCVSGDVKYESLPVSVYHQPLSIPRGPNGGFNLFGKVDDQFVLFQIDTGATRTTLSGPVAFRLGFRQCNSQVTVAAKLRNVITPAPLATVGGGIL